MAVPDGLPSDVVQFVNDTVDSIEQLELLVMLIESSLRAERRLQSSVRFSCWDTGER